jgi:hypothetical protein
MPMSVTRPLGKIAQALLLAVAAWVLAVGAASAHGGHAHAYDRPVTVMASQPVAHEEPVAATAGLSQETEPSATHEGGGCQGGCPGDGPANHAEGCCTIACHAAMAVVGVDAWAGPRIASPVPMLMSDLLEGRCGDCSERPPRSV